MACCPNGVFYPQIRDCSGVLRALEAHEFLRIGNQLFPATPLEADATIYVDPSGDDSLGIGTSEHPYRTIFRAYEHASLLTPGNQDVIIHLNEGIHKADETFAFTFSGGNKISWFGESEIISTPSISNIDVAATTDGSLEYVDFDLNLSGSGAQIGYFVRLDGCTSGTNPDGLNGIHEIVDWDGTTATCRVYRKLSTPELPSGSITVSEAWLIKSVLHFTGDNHGFDIKGPVDLGNFDSIVVRGNATAFGNGRRAFRLFNGAQVRTSTTSGQTIGLYLHEWALGVEAVAGSGYYSIRGGMSKMSSRAMQIGDNSVARLAFQSVINGTVQLPLWAFDAGVIDAATIRVQSCGDTGVLAETNGFVNVTNGRFHYDVSGAAACLIARDAGNVMATGATVSGFATTKSPATNPGNNAANIVGP